MDHSIDPPELAEAPATMDIAARLQELLKEIRDMRQAHDECQRRSYEIQSAEYAAPLHEATANSDAEEALRRVQGRPAPTTKPRSAVAA
ncbi:hypothetical protein AB0G71_12460 [Streptomyces sp. NPDC020403]|uniref:hypothetical protein n=1 Tax=unclassified Streptomyces TaxID=2593676 RepID=UPI0034048A46